MLFLSTPVPIPATSDSLALPKHDADPIWLEMNRRIDLLVEKSLTPKEYVTIAQLYDAPQAFTNLMAVVVADAARRKGKLDAANQAILLCENPVLQELWKRWIQRKAASFEKH